MDPTAIAFLMMELTCAMQTAFAPSGDTIVAVDRSAMNPGYITIQGDVAHGGPIRLIRAGKIIATVYLKKVRSHPELDLKLQPGDILQGAQGIW